MTLVSAWPIRNGNCRGTYCFGTFQTHRPNNAESDWSEGLPAICDTWLNVTAYSLILEKRLDPRS